MRAFLPLLALYVSVASAELAIQQGATTATATQFTVLYAGPEAVKAHVEAKGAKVKHVPVVAETRKLPASPYSILYYRFIGLPPATELVLTLEGATTSKVLDQRNFRTLKVEEKTVRFAVASCMEESHPQQAAQWTALLAKKPDVIFLIGDNVYADTGMLRGLGANESRLYRRYAETRNSLQIFREKNLTPVLATWDDHDYGINDGNRAFVNREEAKRIFGWFFAQWPFSPTYVEGPGVATQMNAFGHRFFLMDDRSFRSEPKAKDETHWGVEQERWLFDQLASDGTPTWILNGDQFFGGYHKFESLEGDHPQAFQRFLSGMKASKAPVALISGDRHLTELMRIPASLTGFETYELTTSAIHANVYPDSWKKNPNPKQIAGVANTINYAVVDSTASEGSLKFKASVYGPKSALLYEKEIDIRR